MKTRYLAGFIVGIIGLTANVAIALTQEICGCGPLMTLFLGALAGFWTAKGEKAASQKDGARLGATSGLVAGVILLASEIIVLFFQSPIFKSLVSHNASVTCCSINDIQTLISDLVIGAGLGGFDLTIMVLVAAFVGYFASPLSAAGMGLSPASDSPLSDTNHATPASASSPWSLWACGCGAITLLALLVLGILVAGSFHFFKSLPATPSVLSMPTTTMGELPSTTPKPTETQSAFATSANPATNRSPIPAITPTMKVFTIPTMVPMPTVATPKVVTPGFCIIQQGSDKLSGPNGVVIEIPKYVTVPCSTVSPVAIAPATIPSTSVTRTATRAPGLHCDNPNAQILSPGMDETIGGKVSFIGVATGPDFLYYKLQYTPDSSYGTSNWAELYQSKTPIERMGKLMEWTTSTVPPGVYWLRLIVADRSGNYPEPCEVRVKVAN